MSAKNFEFDPDDYIHAKRAVEKLLPDFEHEVHTMLSSGMLEDAVIAAAAIRLGHGLSTYPRANGKTEYQLTIVFFGAVLYHYVRLKHAMGTN